MTKDRYGNDEFEIELTEHAANQVESREPGEKVFVEMNETSLSFIYNYSMSDTSQELGGVLLGNYNFKDGKYHINVEAAVEARYTEAARSTVTFTHNTWEYINKVKEEKYPQCTIVGWFHTHPGFGIFLSGYDKFIHQNFFNLPWQVAYVVDPLVNEHGFFGWCNDAIEIIPFSAEKVQLPKKVAIPPVTPVKKKTVSYGNIAAAAALALLAAANIYLFISNQELNRRLETKADAITNLQSEMLIVDELRAERDNYTDQVTELSAQLENIMSLTPLTGYAVQQGDTLWDISERYLGDGHLYKKLAKLNNIVDPDRINVGDLIIIPTDWNNDR